MAVAPNLLSQALIIATVSNLEPCISFLFAENKHNMIDTILETDWYREYIPVNTHVLCT